RRRGVTGLVRVVVARVARQWWRGTARTRAGVDSILSSGGSVARRSAFGRTRPGPAGRGVPGARRRAARAGSRARDLAEADVALDPAGAADDGEGGGVAGREPAQDAAEVTAHSDLLAVQPDDDVGGLDARLVRGRPRRDLPDEDAVLDREVELLSKFGVQVTEGDAEEGAAHASGGEDLVNHVVREVDRDGEPEPDGAAGGANHRGIDADDAAAGVEERAAGVAGVDRGVGLDELVKAGAPGAAVRGGDHAAGDGAFEPGRVADRDRGLADLEAVGVAEGSDGEPAGVDAEHGDVDGRVHAEHGGLEAATVGEGDADRAIVPDDVGVREDDAVRPHDDAGCGAVVVADADHGRRDLADDADELLLLALEGGGCG